MFIKDKNTKLRTYKKCTINSRENKSKLKSASPVNPAASDIPNYEEILKSGPTVFSRNSSKLET